MMFFMSFVIVTDMKLCIRVRWSSTDNVTPSATRNRSGWVQRTDCS